MITKEAYDPDILVRLRNWRGLHLGHYGELAEAAAAEIERLRCEKAETPSETEQNEASIKIGCVALCSRDMLGLVTGWSKSRGAWVGVQLGEEKAGREWISRRPLVVAESVQWLLSEASKRQTAHEVRVEAWSGAMTVNQCREGGQQGEGEVSCV